jgi:anti-sigma regulatory factor (Ser/Thr protein kinase)
VPIGVVAAELGVSPTWVRVLTRQGVFTASLTSGGHRRYDLAATRAAWTRYRLIHATPAGGMPLGSPTYAAHHPLGGLQEDRVWAEVLPRVSLGDRPGAARILAYAVTEMVNNATDHSGGTLVAVQAWRSTGDVVVEVRDDGEGVFAHLAAGLGLADHFASVQELSKGKRTTDPERHTGEGIFFTSKAVDLFHLASNGIAWTADNLRGDHAVGVSPVTTGTMVRLHLDPGTDRVLADVFDEFTEDYEFTRTRPVVKLFEVGVTFVSRSEAKRLLEGMDRFREVVVDFTGVESVGQGFVDELLRVWPKQHPDTKVVPAGMNDAVEFMVRRGIPRPHPTAP